MPCATILPQNLRSLCSDVVAVFVLEQPLDVAGGHVHRDGRPQREVRRAQLQPRLRLRHADAQAQNDSGERE